MKDGEAWYAAVHGVTKSWMQLNKERMKGGRKEGRQWGKRIPQRMIIETPLDNCPKHLRECLVLRDDLIHQLLFSY